MGVKAARLQRVRTRQLVDGIERQVAAYDAQRPEHIARGHRIKTSRQKARRALRARATAELAKTSAESAAGDAIRTLLAEGLSMSDVAVLLEISRGAIKRLARLSDGCPDAPRPSPSTGHDAQEAPQPRRDHREDTGTAGTGAGQKGTTDAALTRGAAR
jgi:hypothetical protein